MAKTGDKHYGKWAITMPPVPVSNADHILGVHIAHDKLDRPDFVTVQYQTADGAGVRALRMDYLNALALLSMLKSIQLDEGSPFPDDPRAHPDR